MQRLAMLNVYTDDSGKGQPPVFVLAGYVSHVDRWKQFSVAWAEVCGRPPSIAYLKMHDAMTLGGEFRGWEKRARDDKLLSLSLVINRFSEYGVALQISSQDFRDVFRGKISRSWDHEYYFASQQIMRMVLDKELASRPTEQVSFIFDEQGRIKQDVEILWHGMKLSLPPVMRRHLGNAPIWSTEQEMPPLQASDMLAWTVRRVAADLVAPWGPNGPLMDMKVLSMGLPATLPRLSDTQDRCREWGVLAQRAGSKAWPAWMRVGVPVLTNIWGREELQWYFDQLKQKGGIPAQYERNKSKRIWHNKEFTRRLREGG